MGYRTIILSLFAVCAAASSAFAMDFANGASVISTAKASVSNVGDAANGTSETDNKLATITQTGNGTGVAEIKFDFPSVVVPSGDDAFYLVVDGTVTGTVEARIWEINESNLRGKTASISGSSLSDAFFALSYSLSTATTITSITVRFTLSNTGDSMTLDAVATPEPSAYALFGFGAILLGWAVRRARRKEEAATACVRVPVVKKR